MFYIEEFIKLCNENNVIVDIFGVADFKSDLKINKVYPIKSQWRPKKFDIVKKIEDEISSIVNIDDYDYFISDIIGFSFKNACTMFHSHTTKYRIETNSNKFIGAVIKFFHKRIILAEKNHYKNSKLIIVGAKEIQKDFSLNADIPIERIKIVPPGINNSYAEQITPKDKNEPYVVGGIACGFNTKGGYNLLNAISELKKEFTPKQVICKIISPHNHNKWWFNLYLKLRGLYDYVEILPYFNDINEFYKSIDCLVCASRNEPFGRVVPESMVIGVPVVCGSNVGASDIIQDGINGYIFAADKNKSKNLAGAIKRAMKNKNNQDELIKNAHDTAIQLTWKNTARKLFEVICNDYKK